MRKRMSVYDKVVVGGSDSWEHIWECICMELGIEIA
jgi:hypothetical protein